MKKNNMIGLDIAKKSFEVCCQNERGKIMERKRLNRGQVLRWFAEKAPSLVGLEACGGAHYWAREIKTRGHDVRIIPPQYVKPYVVRNKNDAHDAKAICRSLFDPGIPTVAIAGPEQQDTQSLHRVRSRLIRERTALVNQIRGFLLEYGITLPKRIDKARKGIQKLIGEKSEVLSVAFQSILEDEYMELIAKDKKIDFYSDRIERLVDANPVGTHVREIPGIGPLTASALLIKVHHESIYRNGRHFSASLGLVPRHDGTGGKVFIRGMSKRGDRYLRTLLIHGARSVVSHVQKKMDPLSLWVKGLVERRGANKAAVALANKNARIAWHLITKEESYQPALAVGRS